MKKQIFTVNMDDILQRLESAQGFTLEEKLKNAIGDLYQILVLLAILKDGYEQNPQWRIKYGLTLLNEKVVINTLEKLKIK